MDTGVGDIMSTIEYGVPRPGVPFASEEPELEIWKSNADGKIVLQRFSVQGGVIHQTIHGHGKVQLTSRERRMNEESAYDDSQNVFKNGMLSPIQIVDAETQQAISENPNLLTEEDMRALVKKSPKIFADKLSEITNIILVNKILEIAKEEDVSIKRVEVIQARVEELSPSRDIHQGRDPMAGRGAAS